MLICLALFCNHIPNCSNHTNPSRSHIVSAKNRSEQKNQSLNSLASLSSSISSGTTNWSVRRNSKLHGSVQGLPVGRANVAAAPCHQNGQKCLAFIELERSCRSSSTEPRARWPEADVAQQGRRCSAIYNSDEASRTSWELIALSRFRGPRVRPVAPAVALLLYLPFSIIKTNFHLFPFIMIITSVVRGARKKR